MTPGEIECLSPHRAEMGGAACNAFIILAICEFEQIKQGRVKMGLDGDRAMKECSGKSPLQASQASFNLLQTIRIMIDKSKINFEFFWVEGHQLERHGKCLHEGTLNDLCDQWAKEKREEVEEQVDAPAAPSHRFLQEGWSLHVNGTKLSNPDEDFLCDMTCGHVTRQHWQDRHSLSDEDFDPIDWDVVRKAMKTWPLGKRKWLAKHLSGFSATGKVML